jgi:acetyltransferase-like isoleucine patch superfamily enzyme
MGSTMPASKPCKTLLASALTPIAGLHRRLGQPLKRLWAHAYLRSIFPALDPSVVALGAPEVQGSGRLILGRNLYLYRDLHLETRDSGSIVIGDDVVLSRGVHLVAHHGIQIGNGSLVGEYTSIRDADHRFGDGVAPRTSGHDGRPVLIGENVWIGRGVTVLPGVCIGDGAVIGANAVVTGHVLPGTVVGGVPARPLLKRAA